MAERQNPNVRVTKNEYKKRPCEKRYSQGRFLSDYSDLSIQSAVALLFAIGMS